MVPMPSTAPVRQESIGFASLLALIKEWGPPVIAGLSDVALATGLVPPRFVLAVRFFVLYCLLRNVISASFAAVLIPRIIPTIIIFVMQRRLRSFRVSLLEAIEKKTARIVAPRVGTHVTDARVDSLPSHEWQGTYSRTTHATTLAYRVQAIEEFPKVVPGIT